MLTSMDRLLIRFGLGFLLLLDPTGLSTLFSSLNAQALKPLVNGENKVQIVDQPFEMDRNPPSGPLLPLSPSLNQIPSLEPTQALDHSRDILISPDPVIDLGIIPLENPPKTMTSSISNDQSVGGSNWLFGGGDFWSQAAMMGDGNDIPPGFLDTIKIESFFDVSVQPYRNYRFSEHSLMLMPTSNQEFGWASLVGTPYLRRNVSQGLNFGMSHHFISGPIDIDLNPRLHEFILGYQIRRTFNEAFSFDCSTTVGFYSDFKGSAREGLRFPSHAVGIIHLTHRTDVIFGVDYLDRDDIKILPVIGISWHDFNQMSLRYDLVFPRPRIDYTVNDRLRFYLMGLLGGGTWDIELVNGPDDVMTYRDYRVVIGQEKRYFDGSRRGLEVGYAFNRRLTLRELPVQLNFRNAFVINFQSTF